MKQHDRPDESVNGANETPGGTRPLMSRRQMVSRTAAMASMLPAMSALAAAAQPRRDPQNGVGPIQVMLITKGESFDRENFFLMFDSFGKEITWTHVEHPAADVFFDPVLAAPYDIFVFWDKTGKGPRPDPASPTPNLEPSPALKAGLKALLQKGKGMLFLHPSIGSWPVWPEYHEVIGGIADWGGLPIKNVRGKEYPYSAFRPGVQQHMTVVDKTHPIVQGLGDGFDIVDEVYLHPIFEDSVHPLLRTDFKHIDSNFPMQYARGWHHPEGNNLVAWVKSAESSPIVYIQSGHDAKAWENPAYRILLMNAIRWTASKEALTWAAANRTTIFR